MNYKTAISHFLSWVLSPILTPTYGIITVFLITVLRYASPTAKWVATAVVFALTCVLPGLCVWLLTRFGNVSDLALTRRTDRLYPYIVITAGLVGAGFYLRAMGVPPFVSNFYFGAAVASVVCFIINFWWKISAHGCGMGGYVALLAIISRDTLPHPNLWIAICVAVILTGLLGSARVYLDRHTPLQTIAGSLVGFLAVFLFANA